MTMDLRDLVIVDAATGNVPAIRMGERLNGHRGPLFPDGQEPEPSSYLRYLPAIYSMDKFVGRFLRIFEDVLSPIEMMVDNQPYYFDPMTAPVGMLDWLEMWVNVDDEADDWSMPKRRALIAAAALIYRMRGTTTGIKKHIGIYAGRSPLVQERTNGFRLGQDAALGLSTVIGEHRPFVFTVTVYTENPREIDLDTLKSMIESDKPIEAIYILRIADKNGKVRTVK